MSNKGVGFSFQRLIPSLDNNQLYHVVILTHGIQTASFAWSPNPNKFVRSSFAHEKHGAGVWTNDQKRETAIVTFLNGGNRTPAYIEFHNPPSVPWSLRHLYPEEFTKYKANYKGFALYNGTLQVLNGAGYIYQEQVPEPIWMVRTGEELKNIPIYPGVVVDVSICSIPRSTGSSERPRRITPPLVYSGTAAPPPPPEKKMSNCCDCNTIATIVQNQSIEDYHVQRKLVEELKNHIDQRVLEIILKDLEHLKALDFKDFLQAILDRINQCESNLWNGINQ